MCDGKIRVLYEDAALWVCVKPVGVSSQDDPGGVPSLLRAAAGNARAYVGVVHRLDVGVGGVMVYAKTKASAAALSAALQANAVQKVYWSAVHGVPDPSAGEMHDLLFKDSRSGKTFVVDRLRKGVRDASLAYRTLWSAEGVSLCEIALRTGRSHQIRVQFSSRGWPLVGDGRYGARDNACGIALWSCRLVFAHPADGRVMRFEVPPAGTVWDMPLLQKMIQGCVNNGDT